ncbi:hypothetical protein K7X08_011436 [Anisodus acutangulus]|uniref:Uncharacterized protein n=1 Tax=Anisodus acutangulus TaxID=402998 RepID=A0A9Q1RLD3_9SOLA|nr:hypothetical protein K7X08_011436 [Anisodus acutangulus]
MKLLRTYSGCGKRSNTLCAMKVLEDFGSIDFKKMLVMQMQIVGFVSSYFGCSRVRIFLPEMDFPAFISLVLDFPAV